MQAYGTASCIRTKSETKTILPRDQNQDKDPRTTTLIVQETKLHFISAAGQIVAYKYRVYFRRQTANFAH